MSAVRPARPLPVTIVGILYVAVGTVSLAYHASRLRAPATPDDAWILASAAVAVVAGAFLLRGAAWARWLALGWMAFHVVVGALHSIAQALVHGLLLAALAYFLLRSDARRYFRE